jgi:hypothetical protein
MHTIHAKIPDQEIQSRNTEEQHLFHKRMQQYNTLGLKRTGKMGGTDIQRQRHQFSHSHLWTNQSKTAQPYTVFKQHCDRFNQLRVDSDEENLTEPRQQMLNDLEERIRAELQGEDEDIHGRRLTKFMNKLELKEAILSRHGTRLAPSTCIEGSTPINGIFTTRGISYKEVDIWHSQKASKVNQTTLQHGSMSP